MFRSPSQADYVKVGGATWAPPLTQGLGTEANVCISLVTRSSYKDNNLIFPLLSPEAPVKHHYCLINLPFHCAMAVESVM